MGAFVGLIFLGWGMDITGKRSGRFERGIIGRVNGEPISYYEYENEINRLYESEKAREGVSELDIDSEKIEEQAFNSLVKTKLLWQEIERRKTLVTDDEVVTIIKSTPPTELLDAEELQTDGKFDYNKYLALISDRRNLGWLIQYENQIRASLPLQKLQTDILSGVKLTHDEIKTFFKERYEKVKVTYLFVNPNSIACDTFITEERIVDLYDEHRDDFTEPEKASLEYVFFEKKPSETDELEVKKEIEAIYDELKAGGDFVELAQIYSQDPGSAADGGDLGEFVRGTMVPEFESVVFSMKRGEISKPFRTQFGWHIVTLEKLRGDKASARHILLRVRPSYETLEEHREKVREFANGVKKDGLEETAKRYDVELDSTDFFPIERYIPGIGFSKEIYEFVLNEQEGKVSDVIVIRTGYLILKIIGKMEKRLLHIDEARERIKEQILNTRRRSLAKEKATEIVVEIRSGKNLHKVAKRYGIEVYRSPWFSKNEYVEGVPFGSEFYGASFSLQKEEVSNPIETEWGYYTIKLEGRLKADEKKFEEEKDNLARELLQKRQQEVYIEWLSNLKQRATIEDYRRRFL